MKGIPTPRLRHRTPRTVLSLALIAGAFVLACDLDDGERPGLPRTPSVIPDIQGVTIQTFISPPNIPADGVSASLIHARIFDTDGNPLVGVPVLFYSEWGTIFTACTTPTTVTPSAFSAAIFTGPNGEASTPIIAPVLPNLYTGEQESNTIAAFALIDGVVIQAINNQNLWQVDLTGFTCRRTGNFVQVTARFAGRNTLGVSGCEGVTWLETTQGVNEDIPNTECTENGTTTATVSFAPDPNDPPPPFRTVQVSATFNGGGLNECGLDRDATVTISGSVRVNRNGNPVCQ